jgi:hypothetical protein
MKVVSIADLGLSGADGNVSSEVLLVSGQNTADGVQRMGAGVDWTTR